jgi:hypothetical protein
MARGDGGKTVFETVNHKRQKQLFNHFKIPDKMCTM